jgi:cyanophycinase
MPANTETSDFPSSGAGGQPLGPPGPKRVGRLPGTVALVGGAEWSPGCEPIDRALVELSRSSEVLVLPTAAAFERPEKAIATAQTYFSRLGVPVAACMVLSRSDAEDPALAGAVRRSRFTYLSGGSVLHLRSVLKSSLVWHALVAAWAEGATLAGSSAGAMVFGDTMVDPRGGALTLGLGLLTPFAVLPHASDWSAEKTHRTVRLASGGLRIAAVDERTALLRSPEGQWKVLGEGQVRVFVDGRPASLADLEAVEPVAHEPAGA